MHELAIASGIVDRAVEAAREHGAESVDGLTLEVGRATHLNPDQLRFCVETVAEGTIAAGASVAVETVDPRGTCACGWAGRPDAVESAVVYVPNRRCPDCGGSVELTRGTECRLARVEIPETEPPAESPPPDPP